MDKSTITRDGSYVWDSDLMRACSELYAETIDNIIEAHFRLFGGSMEKALIWDYVYPKDYVESVSVSFSEILEALPLSRSNLQRKLSELVEAGFLKVTTQPASGQSLYRIGNRGVQETIAASQDIHVALLEYGQKYSKVRGLSVEECVESAKTHRDAKVGHEGG